MNINISDYGEIVPQVQDLTSAEVAALRWPDGQGVPRVGAVLAAVAPRFHRVAVDLKIAERGGLPLGGQRLAALVAEVVRGVPCPTCVFWAGTTRW